MLETETTILMLWLERPVCSIGNFLQEGLQWFVLFAFDTTVLRFSFRREA